MEHHSNIVPWQLLAERTGAQLVFLSINGDAGLLDPGQLDALLTSDVKLLAMTHISNSLGTINPITEYCERARQRGIVTPLIDAALRGGHHCNQPLMKKLGVSSPLHARASISTTRPKKSTTSSNSSVK
jgi:selenocysteine lyase/cysteine desulfurase